MTEPTLFGFVIAAIIGGSTGVAAVWLARQIQKLRYRRNQ